MAVENYVQTAPDSLGKKIRAVEETVGADTVHTPVTIIEDGSGNIISPAKETGGNLAAIATNTASLAQPTTAETPNSGLSGGIILYLTPSATANVKGSYYQITEATTAETKGIILTGQVQWVASTAAPVIFVDIAIGTTIILPDLPIICDQPSTRWSGTAYVSCVKGYIFGQPTFIPIKIPADSQIQARCQSSIGSFGCSISITFLE